jgi:hypothetical protein
MGGVGARQRGEHPHRGPGRERAGPHRSERGSDNPLKSARRRLTQLTSRPSARASACWESPLSALSSRSSNACSSGSKGRL